MFESVDLRLDVLDWGSFVEELERFRASGRVGACLPPGPMTGAAVAVALGGLTNARFGLP